MIDELKELKSFIKRFDKTYEKLELCYEVSEDEKNFLYHYQLHLANAIMLSVGDDNAKKVAKIILSQIEA